MDKKDASVELKLMLDMWLTCLKQNENKMTVIVTEKFMNCIVEAINALDEVQEYNSIGTVVECNLNASYRKKMQPLSHGGNDYCAWCHTLISTSEDKFCSECGQAILWEDSDESGSY